MKFFSKISKRVCKNFLILNWLWWTCFGEINYLREDTTIQEKVGKCDRWRKNWQTKTQRRNANVESLNLGTPKSKIKSATETRTRAKTRGRFQQKI